MTAFATNSKVYEMSISTDGQIVKRVRDYKSQQLCFVGDFIDIAMTYQPFQTGI